LQFALLHIFEKRSGALPEADKRIARDRWTDFQAAHGRDAAPPRPGRLVMMHHYPWTTFANVVSSRS
jgi:hypothetical protein